MAELSAPPVEQPPLETPAPSNAPAPPSDEQPSNGGDAPLASVLLEGGELAFGVRLRIALDLLEHAAEQGNELAARTASSRHHLENVRIDSEGIARAVGDGPTDGVGEMLWEIVAGAPLEERGSPPPPVSEVSDDVIESIDHVVASAFAAGEARPTIRELAAAFEEAGRGYLDTHEDVRHALGLDRSEEETVSLSVPAASGAPASATPRTTSAAPAAAAAAAESAGDSASDGANGEPAKKDNASADGSAPGAEGLNEVKVAAPDDAANATGSGDSPLAEPTASPLGEAPESISEGGGPLAAPPTAPRPVAVPPPSSSAARGAEGAASPVAAFAPIGEISATTGLPKLDRDEDLEPTKVRDVEIGKLPGLDAKKSRSTSLDDLFDDWEPPEASKPPTSGVTAADPIPSSKSRVLGGASAAPPSGPSGLPTLVEEPTDEETLDEPTQVVPSKRGVPRAVSPPRRAPTPAAGARAPTSAAPPLLGETLPKLDEDDESTFDPAEIELTRRFERGEGGSDAGSDDAETLVAEARALIGKRAAAARAKAKLLMQARPNDQAEGGAAVPSAATDADPIAQHAADEAEPPGDAVEAPVERASLDELGADAASAQDDDDEAAALDAGSAPPLERTSAAPRFVEASARRARAASQVSTRRDRVFVLVLAAMCLAAIGIAALTALRAEKATPPEHVEQPAER